MEWNMEYIAGIFTIEAQLLQELYLEVEKVNSPTDGFSCFAVHLWRNITEENPLKTVSHAYIFTSLYHMIW